MTSAPAVAKMTLAQRAELCASLGLPETTSNADVVAAVQRVGAGDTATGALPPGVAAIDATKLEELREAARRGEQIAEQDRQRTVMNTVEAAVRDGRIPPAARKGWVASLQKDPGGTSAAHLARMAKGLVPYAAIGYLGDGQPDDGDDEDREVQHIRNQAAYKGWEL